jgi:hypothetical protein
MNDPVQTALRVAGVHTGPIAHDGAGRTDDVEMSVPGESFVVPADIVSAIGQGNTAHGFRVLNHMFPPRTPQRAAGGAVPIMSAGGEFVIGPEHVARVGGGDLKKGHEALRDFVHHVRQRTIRTLKKLPKPVRG